MPPLGSSAPVRTQRFRPPPGRAGTGCGIRPSEGGPGPRATAGERRLAQGGFPRDTTKGRVCWPAAKSPQASALPGIQGSQGFRGHGRPPRGTVRGVSPPPVLSKLAQHPARLTAEYGRIVRRGGRNHLFLHILSDPTWVGKWWAILKVYRRFSWGPS